MSRAELKGVPTMTVEVAQVYRVGRRRWFTKRAGIHALAREWVKRRCFCENGEEPEYADGGMSYLGSAPYICKYHDPERYPALIERLHDLAAKHVRDTLT